jgi:hypothetical protein
MVQLVKKIVHMGNWMSVARQICHFWSMRSALLLMEKLSADFSDHVEYSSELRHDLSDSQVLLSPVMQSVRLYDKRWQVVRGTRSVRSFDRGPLQVRGNDFVLASLSDGVWVGRVTEMVEFAADGGPFTCLLLTEMRPVDSFDPMRSTCLIVKKSVTPTERVVPVETTQFHELFCDDEHEGELRLTYIY